MTEMGPEERLALLLRELPPAPEAWLDAAKALPAARRALDAIDDQVLRDAGERQAVTSALEEALRRVDVQPTAERLAALERLAGLRRDD